MDVFIGDVHVLHPDAPPVSPQIISTVTLDDLRESLVLPSSQWIIQATESVAEIRVCKLQHVASVRSQSVVSHSLIINSDLTWSAFVHGHSIDGSRSRVLSAIPVKLDCESLRNLLSKLVCVQAIQTSTFWKWYYLKKVT